MKYVFFLSLINRFKMSSAVVGGEFSRDEQYPYAISLHNDGRQFCAGVLVDLEYVLSTCHCVGIFNQDKLIAYEPDNINLVAGDSWVTSMASNWNSLQRRRCDEIIIHPNCTDKTFGWGFDYSLLKARHYFHLTATVQPMEFPYFNPETVNLLFEQTITERSGCYAIGWGHQFVIDRRLNSSPSDRLKAAFVRLMPWQHCLSLLCLVGPEKVCEEMSPEYRTKACATGMGASDSCTLDDGGPVVCNGYVLALVSKGIGCLRYKKPRLIVRIDFAMGFIREIIQRNLNEKRYSFMNHNRAIFSKTVFS